MSHDSEWPGPETAQHAAMHILAGVNEQADSHLPEQAEEQKSRLLTKLPCRAGYKLDTGEVDRLLDQLDLGHTGRVAKGQFAASQIDWGALQQNHARWLECVRRAFDEFDTDGDGVCSVQEIVACLKAKLPLTEVGPTFPIRTMPTASVP